MCHRSVTVSILPPKFTVFAALADLLFEPIYFCNANKFFSSKTKFKAVRYALHDTMHILRQGVLHLSIMIYFIEDLINPLTPNDL
jgi:hypothetical protein